MTRDPMRYPSAGTLPTFATRRPVRSLWRSRAASALWASGLLALALTVLGAVLDPAGYLPQASFASSVVLLLGACWASEGGR
jgi:di/tricarboxylate transporter